MTTKQTGGPAFPRAGSDYSKSQSGMTLRDYFAGQALAGMLVESMHDCGAAGIAWDCYQFADAMLKEREK